MRPYVAATVGHAALAMAKNLVIVESPAKARTIEKYLGSDFEVLASYGHVRDLVPKEGAVDPEQRLRDEVSAHRQEREARRQDRQGREESFGRVSRDRPGSRRRSDFLARLRGAQGTQGARLEAGAARRVPRGHEARDPRSHRPAARLVRAARQRAAGAPRARLPRRLQPVAAAVEEGAPRPLGRPRAEPGAAARSSSARTRSRRSRPQEYWTIEALARAGEQAFPARLAVYGGEKVEQFTFTNEAAVRAAEQRIRDTAARHADRREGRQEAAPAQSGGAVHDLDAATGSVAQARLQRAAHDDAWRSGSTKASTSAKAPSA